MEYIFFCSTHLSPSLHTYYIDYLLYTYTVIYCASFSKNHKKEKENLSIHESFNCIFIRKIGGHIFITTKLDYWNMLYFESCQETLPSLGYCISAGLLSGIYVGKRLFLYFLPKVLINSFYSCYRLIPKGKKSIIRQIRNLTTTKQHNLNVFKVSLASVPFSNRMHSPCSFLQSLNNFSHLSLPIY